MRFMNGLNLFVGLLSDLLALKQGVETLGFIHLNLDVTIPIIQTSKWRWSLCQTFAAAEIVPIRM